MTSRMLRRGSEQLLRVLYAWEQSHPGAHMTIDDLFNELKGTFDCHDIHICIAYLFEKKYIERVPSHGHSDTQTMPTLEAYQLSDTGRLFIERDLRF